MPVTYADVWEFWLRNRVVYDAVDFVTIHILPYWEDFPIAAQDAAAHVDSIRRRMVAAFPDKDILIGETGWPSAGRMREGALPSPVNQARIVHEVLALAKRDKFRVNIIEAFDQPWKRRLEGTVGGHWGLLDDADPRTEIRLGRAAVRTIRIGEGQATAGLALAAIVFAAALAARRRSPMRGGTNVARLSRRLPPIAGIADRHHGRKNCRLKVSERAAGCVRSWRLRSPRLAPVVGSVALIRRISIPRICGMCSRAAANGPRTGYRSRSDFFSCW